MNAAQLSTIQPTFTDPSWVSVCSVAELKNNLGARALLNGEQVAMFRVQGQLFAISAIDPFSKAAVLSRGLIGDLRGQMVVASPIYKQHFNLATGQCLEDDGVAVRTFLIRELDGQIQLGS